jgi:hypothetical protein
LVTAVVKPPAKVQLAPDEGAVNVTVAPTTGLLPDKTVATSGAANAVLIAAVCGVPDVAVIVVVTAAVFVKVKTAGVTTPETVALTW